MANIFYDFGGAESAGSDDEDVKAKDGNGGEDDADAARGGAAAKEDNMPE